MKVRRILTAIDFGKQTERVVAYAAFFAERFGSSLTLLHVIDYLVTPPAYLDAYIDEERKAAEVKFRTIRNELSTAGISVDTKVVVGRLQASFETAVNKTGADMLVLGFVSHALRRSSAEKLIKGLRMPMLVVRGEKPGAVTPGRIAIRKILCPVDFSDISERALRTAMELAGTCSADLEVMYVMPELTLKKIQHRGHKDKTVTDYYEMEKDRFSKFLTASSFGKAGIMDQGEPRLRIVACAREHEIDLIVMGARGLGLIQGMIIGSVTDAVLKSAPCPVFVIH